MPGRIRPTARRSPLFDRTRQRLHFDRDPIKCDARPAHATAAPSALAYVGWSNDRAGIPWRGRLARVRVGRRENPCRGRGKHGRGARATGGAARRAGQARARPRPPRPVR
jgi:hypothetical protein